MTPAPATRVDRILNALDTVLVEWLGAALLAAAVLMVFIQVFTRNVLGFTSVWAEEMPRYAIILAVCIALADAWRNERHLRMTLVVSAMPRWARRLARLVVDAAGLAYSAYLSNAGIDLVRQQYEQQVTTGTSLDFPAWIPSTAIPIGAGLLALACLAGLVRNVTGRWDPLGGR